MSARAPSELVAPLLSLGQAGRLLGWMLVGLLLALGAILLLPINPYYRYQQTDGTILFRARWIYERIHFDPTPIDVAMIGSSRMEASVRADEVGRRLGAKLGRPVHVVNFGLPEEGRNLHWLIVKELLENRSGVQLIVLSAGREAAVDHPAFRFLGDDASIAGSPIIYNTSYMQDLLTIPYQHIAYFVQGLSPAAFQLSPRFDPAVYRALGFDPTRTFRGADGKLVDRDLVFVPPLSRAPEGRERWYMRFLTLDQHYAIERHFLRRIAALARQKGTRIAFLRVPTYDNPETFADRAFYTRIGPMIEASQFGADPGDYMDIAHLNRSGTAKLAPWLADRLAPLLVKAGH